MGKQLELLKDVTGNLSRVAILANPANGEVHRQYVEAIEVTARVMKIAVAPAEMIESPVGLPSAFSAFVRARADGLIILPDGMFFNERKRLAEMAVKNRLPTIFLPREFADSGGLLSFGPNLASIFRRAGYYVHRIIMGTKPQDLPVELPTRYDFVINLKTARELGLTIPPSVLLRANELIQ